MNLYANFIHNFKEIYIITVSVIVFGFQGSLCIENTFWLTIVNSKNLIELQCYLIEMWKRFLSLRLFDFSARMSTCSWIGVSVFLDWGLCSRVPKMQGTWERDFLQEHMNKESEKVGTLISRSWTFINICVNISFMWQVMLLLSSIRQNFCHISSIFFISLHKDLYNGPNAPTFLTAFGKFFCPGTRNAKSKLRNAGHEGSSGMRAPPSDFVWIDYGMWFIILIFIYWNCKRH